MQEHDRVQNLLHDGAWSSADSIQATVLVTVVTKVLEPTAAHLTSPALGENGDVLIPFQHL